MLHCPMTHYLHWYYMYNLHISIHKQYSILYIFINYIIHTPPPIFFTYYFFSTQYSLHTHIFSLFIFGYFSEHNLLYIYCCTYDFFPSHTAPFKILSIFSMYIFRIWFRILILKMSYEIQLRTLQHIWPSILGTKSFL